MHLPIPLLLSLLHLPTMATARNNDDKILLSSVHSLTLRANAMTSHRRVAAVPQLTCEGPACRYYEVDSLRCTNGGSGYDSEDIQWTCTASLPSAFKLGSTDVQCEGYASSRDKHVLRGSCGATYRLQFTAEGEREYADQIARDRSWFSSSSHRGQTTEGSFGGKLFMLVFVAVAAWILYNAYLRSTQNRQAPRRVTGGGGRRPGGGGGGGGGYPGGGWWPGGGGGGWNTGSDPADEPPPPYSPNAPRYAKSTPSASSQQGWGLGNRGFWTGALGGAAAGYLAGSRRGGNQEPRRRGWGGGGGGTGWGSSMAGTSSGSRSSSGSGRTYESTGFGGTSRR